MGSKSRGSLEPRLAAHRSISCLEVSCGAGIRACAGGGQWQQVLSLLEELGQVELEPDVEYLMSLIYSSVIRACEKGRQCHKTKALLSQLDAHVLKPGVAG
ncbi:unnamed protein product [Prorocentrum cordatum]|uniref:Uncharacterized protein n=1 Tax=Prorocentrum cordatum TaxID=2364126 RepID=A0ABN9WZB4_9DINO|nr:unnamed protein product [Polarella glacialis]